MSSKCASHWKLDLRRSMDDRRGAAIESYGLATLFDYQGRFGAAVNSMADALKTFRDIKDKTPWMAKMLDGYAEALILAGRGDEAKSYLDEARWISPRHFTHSLYSLHLGRVKAGASLRLCRHGMKRLFTVELVYRHMYTGIEMANELKPVRWIGTSLRDLRSSPRQVRIDIGQAFAAQEGKTDPAAKPLKASAVPAY